MPRALPFVLCLLTLAPAAAQQESSRRLVSGQTVHGRLPDGDKVFQSYRVQVPVGSTRLVIRAVGKGDVDLYVRAGTPIVDSWIDESHARANSEAHTETIELTPAGTPTLRATTYYIDAVNATQTAFSYTLTATVERGEGPGATPLEGSELGPKGDGSLPLIDADHEATFELAADGSNFRTFAVEVGPDVSELTMTTRGAGSDVDIYARYGEPMPDWNKAEHAAATPAADEVLVLSRGGGVPRLRTGVYYVDVARATEATTPVTLTIRFTRGYSGPEAPAGSLTPSTETGVEGEVTRDAVFSADLDGGRPFRTYVLVVPKQADSVLINVAHAEQDVDLYLRHGQQIEDYTKDPDHRANGARRDEQLYVDRASDPPLRPGRYYLDVVRATEASPGAVEVTVRFDVERPPAQPATPGPVTALTLGERLEVKLKRSEHKAGRYRFTVPAGARSLHVTTLRATRDVDLFLRRGGPITSYDAATGYHHKAVTPLLSERLRVTTESDPPLEAGEYFLDVASLIHSDEHIGFTLVVTVDVGPSYAPADLPLPPYRQGGNPLERAVRATVQLASPVGEGSGTCLTPSGLIVTNAHVVLSDDGVLQSPIYVSFVDQIDQPPRQCFLAEVVAHDAELDLALLQIERDVLDRPLPQPLQLPWLALGDPGALHLGDPLVVAGYPAVGGAEARTSLTITRGIVSGFTAAEDGGGRNWVKTDARINAGNSGGTALGPDLRLVGVPTLEQVSGDDELGYCRAVTRLPQAWRDQIAAALREGN